MKANKKIIISSDKLHTIGKVTGCVIGVGAITTAIALPIALTRKTVKLTVNGQNYCYLNEEIDKNNLEVYESNGKNITKLNTSDFSISPTKFEKKFDDIQMVTLTSKNGNSTKFPVKMLESYEMNEQSFKNFPRELGYNDIIIETKDKGRDDFPNGNYKLRESNETITKHGNKEFYYSYSHGRNYDKEGSPLGDTVSQYTGRGHEKVYDEKTGNNIFYSLYSSIDQKTGKVLDTLDYHLPSGNTLEYIISKKGSTLEDRYNFNGRKANFNNYVLKDDKSYEISENISVPSSIELTTYSYTFENGKLQKGSGKEIIESIDGSKTEEELSIIVKRVTTTDPFINVQRLNYQYVATSLEGNKFETTVTDSSTAPITFDLKFFEDYDAINQKYINEVKEGYYVDRLTKDLLTFVDVENVNVAFDENEKLRIKVNPDGGSFQKGTKYEFYIKFDEDYDKGQTLRSNWFLYYVNSQQLYRDGIRFVINVQ